MKKIKLTIVFLVIIFILSNIQLIRAEEKTQEEKTNNTINTWTESLRLKDFLLLPESPELKEKLKSYKSTLAKKTFWIKTRQGKRFFRG